MADDGESIFAKAGFDLPKAAPSSVAAVKKADAKAEPSIFEAAGFKVPSAKATVAAEPASNLPTPDRVAADVAQYGVNNSVAKPVLAQIHEAIDPFSLGWTGAKNTYHDTVENAVASASLARQGMTDIGNRNYLPTMPSADPSTWTAGGLLKSAGGALGVPASLVAGPVNALMTRPATELTGNPEIGERAGFVANALVPIRGGGAIVEKTAPSTKATNALVEAIRPENVPELVAGMRANPRMTAADLSDPVRLTTQGLMAKGTPDVQDLISRTVRERSATRLDNTNSAYTEAMGPAPDVMPMLDALKKRSLGQDAQLKTTRESLDSVMGPSGDPHAEMQALRNRQEMAVSPQATTGKIDQSIGRAIDPYDELHQMIQQRSADAAPLYTKALDRPVVWDDRLQQFIDDPIVKQGLAQGVRIQRLESLAANEPFRPSDYAIKSFNEAGDPIIGETPNMRTLNVVKKGLDAKVQEMTDPVTGRLSEEGRAVNEVRKSFLAKMDEINPDYKAARQAWAGPSQAHEAFNRGLNVFQNRAGSSGVNTTPAALNSWFNGASAAERDAARIGARSAFEQQMKASGDQTAKASALASKEVNREKLNILFGGDQANRLVERLNATHEDPIGTGFTRGLDLFQNKAGSAGAESTPEALAAWHKNASPEAQQAARAGARTAVDQQMKAASDPATKGAALANKEINQEKLAVLFGKEGADKIVSHLNSKFEDPIQEAFEGGFDVLKNRSGVEGLKDRPEVLADWMKTATPEQVVARRLGVRTDIDQKINSVKNGSLAGQTVAAIPYNQEKLKMLFGNDEAGRLIRVMKDAEREAATNAAIFAGSKTAETTAAGGRIAVRKVGGGNPLQYVAPVAAEMLGQSAGLPGAGLLASMAAKGVHMTAQKLGQMHDIASNAEFARNALATGPAREEAIQRLLSHPKVISELKKRSNALVAP